MSADLPLLVVKAGATFPELIREYGDFEDWIIKGLGRGAACCRGVKPTPCSKKALKDSRPMSFIPSL